MRNEPITDCRLRITECELKNPESERSLPSNVSIGGNPKSRGVSLIAAVFIIVILAFMGVIFLTLFTGSSSSSINDLQSAQAYYVAEGGIERTLFQFKAGTACAALTSGAVTLGPGSFTVAATRFQGASTLSAAITNAAVTIPVVSAAAYAPHGRITIDAEAINYTGIAGNNLTGAQRGVAGTAAVNHLVGRNVVQDQCQILSTGSVGGAVRTAEVNTAGVAPPSSAPIASLDSPSTAVGTAATTVATLPASFPAGDNLIIAVVSFRNINNDRDIAAGNLRLLNGAALLTSNQSLIRVGNSPVGANAFPQETQFLLYKDVGAGLNPTYTVTAFASGNNISAEVKMVAINGIPNSSFQDGGNVAIGTAQTTILSHASTVPAGDNIIIAAVQLDNTSGGSRTINVGGLSLNKGAAALASNQFIINLERSNRVKRGLGMLLIARDTGAAANPTYTVTGLADNNGINGAVKIIVVNGLQSAFLDGNIVAVGTAATVVGSLSTTLPAGDNLIIAANQYDNGANGTRTIAAGNERIVQGGVTRASSQFDIDLCATGTAVCDDFTSGLLWLHAGAVANPTYDVRALAGAAGINAETKIMVINLNIPGGIPIYGWQ